MNDVDLTNTVIDDRYRVDGLLHQFSTLGSIYRAWDHQLERSVSLRINGLVDGHPIGESYVRHEAIVLAQLSHPGVEQVYDMGRHEGLLWYASELLVGGSLSDMLRDEADPQDFLRVMGSVAETLSYVHRRGYVHRGLQPNIILFDVLGRPRIGDFGFAAAIENGTLLKAPMAIGRTTYMSPEVRSLDDHLGPAADVWSMGLMLLARWIGEDALEQTELRLRETQDEVDVGAIEAAIDQMIVSVAGDLPEGLEEVIRSCVTYEPDQRLQDGRCLQAALDTVRTPGCTAPAPQVFVSHATRDRSLVDREIVAPLERASIPTWYAKADIDSASQWERTILKGLESSEWFLLVLTPQSAASEWVKDEVHWAIRNRPDAILPVLVEACDPYLFHIRIARIQWVDLTHDLAAGRRALVERLGRRPDVTARPPETP